MGQHPLLTDISPMFKDSFSVLYPKVYEKELSAKIIQESKKLFSHLC